VRASPASVSAAGCSGPTSYSGLADGDHVFEVEATDPAGNVEISPASHSWTIDTAVPNTTITSGPPNLSVSGAASFDFDASEAGSTFRCELDGGGFSACSSPQGYAGLGDGSHTFKVKAIDGAGNVDATPALYTWTIDATPPGGGLGDPGSPLRGTVTLSASPTDSGAGVREVEFQYSPANAAAWTTIATDPSAPYTASWDTAAAGDGLYDLRIVATDNASNAAASPEVEDRRVDNTPPAVTMDDPGAYLRGTVALTSNASDGGSGMATLSYQRSPAGADAWTPILASWDTPAVADGLYDLRVVATDGAGNATASALVSGRRVDNTAPSLSGSTPADGALVASADSLALVANEDLAGVSGATIDGSPAPAPVASGAILTYTAAFDDGPHTLSGELEDLAGNRRAIRVHFTVWSLAAADYPWVEKNSFATVPMTLAATNGGGEVTVPAAAWSGAAPGDWLVVRVDPRPPATVSGGFETAGDIYDVTAYWALDGSAVHNFAKALDLTITNGAGTIVPATFESDSWRAIAPIPSGQTLPSGWQDGFYRSGSDVHILTKHLSSFSLLKDVQAPTKPGSFSGSRSNGRLVLRWKAATDNGVVGAYLVYANGTVVRTLAASAGSVKMGRFKTSDSRRFRVAARDSAGNVGAKTRALVIVPALAKLTLAQAKARLVGRGLRPGAVSYLYSTTVSAGRVIGARSGVVFKGAAIALTVSRGPSGRTSYAIPTGTSGGTGSGGTTYSGSGYGGTPTPSSLSSGSGATQGGTGGGSPAPFESGDSSGVGQVEPQSFTPADDDTTSPLRRILGLALLGGAFLAAGGVALRARRPRLSPPTQGTGAVDSLLFWDQRLLHAVTASVRRVTGRF
jgi:hypothetical protein